MGDQAELFQEQVDQALVEHELGACDIGCVWCNSAEAHAEHLRRFRRKLLRYLRTYPGYENTVTNTHRRKD